MWRRRGVRLALGCILIGLPVFADSEGLILDPARPVPRDRYETGAPSPELSAEEHLHMSRSATARSARMYHAVKAGMLWEARREEADAISAYQQAVEQAVVSKHRVPIITRQLCLVVGWMSPEGADLLSPGEASPGRVRDWLERIYANDPDHPHAAEVLYRLGLYHEQRGRLPQARDFYVACEQKSDATNWRERAHLAMARTRVEDYRAHPTDHGRATLALNKLNTLSKEASDDRIQLAAQTMKKILEAEVARTEFEMARYYDTKTRNVQAARSAYAQFLNRYPDAPDAEAARERLRFLLGNDLNLRHTPVLSDAP